MPYMTQYSDEDLRQELRRREGQANIEIPPKLATPNIEPLAELVAEHLRLIACQQHDEDMEHYIYEAALEAWYGKDVWKFINAKS
jgi:hypothetical protein